jgi:hypothetical protein
MSSEQTNPEEQIVPVNVSISDEFIKQMGEEYSRQMQILAPQEYYPIDIDGQTINFRRRKILSKERRELEGVRAKLEKSARDNDGKYPDLEDSLYKKMANMYLIDPNTDKGMTEKQFDSTVYEDIKMILNACAFRTERPIPSPFGNQK